jgi:hypothetical protein
MRSISAAVALVLLGPSLAATVQARTWTDRSGEYNVEAELVAFDDEVVVVRRDDHELAAIPLAELSDGDREFLKSQEAADSSEQLLGASQKWQLQNGETIEGKVVDFADRELAIERRRGRIFVNDRLINNLPEFYQRVVPQIVAHQEKLPRADGRALRNWLIERGEGPQSIRVQGMVIEDASGDEFAVPFFLFSEEDLKLLQPGWEEWVAAYGKKDYETAEDLGFLLRSLAAARQQDHEVKREIALLQIKMQAIEAGVTSLWEVTLYPVQGNAGPPLWVTSVGRNNVEATNAALERHPGHVAGPVRRLSRRTR